MKKSTTQQSIAVLFAVSNTAYSSANAADLLSVTYQARFKWELANTCSGSKAPLLLECPYPDAQLTVLESSHPNIQWFPRDNYNSSVQFGDVVCSDYKSCTESFVTEDDHDDTFGEIYFICSGFNREATQASVTYQGGDDSYCEENIWAGTGGFHYLELGILCDSQQDVLVYPHQWLECLDEGESENVLGRYSCRNGMNCGGGPCTVSYQNVTIASYPTLFDDVCFQMEPVADTAPPSEDLNATDFLEEEEVFAPGNYTVKYKALWTIDATEGNFAYFCDFSLPEVEIVCLDGARLVNIDPLYPEVECQQMSESKAQCRETCIDCKHYFTKDSLEYRFSGVTYVS